jgi:glucose/arabinose dehydrogenase
VRDTDGDGVADARFEFADDLELPFGIAFSPSGDWLYVANTGSVVRYHYSAGQTKSDEAPETITQLPGHGYNQHWTRNIAFSPDGSKLYVTVGSSSNDDDDPAPRASILEMNPDGSARRIFARGLRNPVGLAFEPTTGALWAAVEERDRLGDDLVPDYVTSVKDGGYYGWPFAYAGPREYPRHANERPDLVHATITPDVLVQAHSAVLGLAFYRGTMFPPEYRGDAFVALHGSWNRTRRTGYKVIRIHFQDGHPTGGYDDFVTGWMLDPDRTEVWGRPVGVLVAKDGALLVTDDGSKSIWRITHR